MTKAWPFKIDETQDWAYWDGAFTPEECISIIAIAENKPVQTGLVSSTSGSPAKASVRESAISWLYPDDDLQWAFRRITDIATELNSRYFGFDLWGMAEGLQFTRYHAPTGRYGRHIDRSTGLQIRKLSMTMQLSDPSHYDGGDLLIHAEEEPQVMKRQQGTLVAFPSYMLHEVTPVTRGTRYSLVSWITGPAFK